MHMMVVCVLQLYVMNARCKYSVQVLANLLILIVSLLVCEGVVWYPVPKWLLLYYCGFSLPVYLVFLLRCPRMSRFCALKM